MMLCFFRKKYQVEVLPSVDGQWFYRVRAGNNEVLCVSEMYPTKGIALEMATRLTKAKLVLAKPSCERG
jgi:uncharacterized protein YegP (UPF0339 family)